MQQVEVEEGRRILFMFLGRWPVTVNEAVTRVTRNIRTMELTFGSHGSFGRLYDEYSPDNRIKRAGEGEQESALDSSDL